MVARIFVPHFQTSHDAEAAKHHGRHRFYRFAELAAHTLHLISTVVVLTLVIYFFRKHHGEIISDPFWAALVSRYTVRNPTY